MLALLLLLYVNISMMFLFHSVDHFKCSYKPEKKKSAKLISTC